jgi:hypothetical protein
VHGEITTGNGAGVVGISTNGIGVHAVSQSYEAVHAETNVGSNGSHRRVQLETERYRRRPLCEKDLTPVARLCRCSSHSGPGSALALVRKYSTDVGDRRDPGQGAPLGGWVDLDIRGLWRR